MNLYKILQIILCSLPFIGACLLNGKIALNKENRGRQFFMPFIALVYGIVVMIAFEKIHNIVSDLFGYFGLNTIVNSYMIYIMNLLMVVGFIPIAIAFPFMLKIEQVAGYYECKKCGHRYVPTMKAINLAPHMGRTRHMKCPKCGEKSWQKKVISKEDK